jgi:hypothetical protein
MFTGPPGDKDHISSSGLAEIKRVLISGQPFLGDEKYLIFGSEVHRRFLERKHNKLLLTFEEETAIKGMLTSLSRHKTVRQLMTGSIFEQTKIGLLEGVRFKMIGDIINTRKSFGADLKTTSCKTEKQFVDAAINKYEYLRQSWCYKQVEQLKEFYFIGIQKQEPYQVFILNVNNYAKEEARTIAETRFLLEIYKHYGRPVRKSQ